MQRGEKREEVIKACPAGACLVLGRMRWDGSSTLGVYALEEKKRGSLVSGRSVNSLALLWFPPGVAPVPNRQDSNQTCRVWGRKNIVVPVVMGLFVCVRMCIWEIKGDSRRFA